MDSYDILVIILSIALSVSIIVWIFVGVLALKVLKKVKEASDTAKQAVENVEALTEQLKNVGKATAYSSAIGQIFKAFKRRK
ncbi:hypothetical protein KBB49_03395 [Candidatus Saccharibacteria bacterium]|nr:hypothetical protein [Candidatus Saccharibacteria bacterium]